MNSWEIVKEYGYTIKIWDDDALEKFINIEYPAVLPVIKAARNYAEISDICRYLLVYHYGGHYFDWDTELLSLNKFLEICKNNPSGYLVQDPVNQTIASEAFSALPKEQYLYNLVDNICYIHENGYSHTMKTPDYSGPYRMREVYYFTKKASKQTPIRPADIFLYDYWEIRTKPYREEERAMIHYWEHGWMK
jgi:mannosyltransferase OCH1-like enzyme